MCAQDNDNGKFGKEENKECYLWKMHTCIMRFIVCIKKSASSIVKADMLFLSEVWPLTTSIVEKDIKC